MKRNIMALFFVLMAYGCGASKDSPSPGSAAPGKGSGEEQVGCVKSHPAIQKKEFSSMRDAVEAFARIQIDCKSSKKQLTDIAQEMEKQ